MLDYAYSNSYNVSYWNCICDCGGKITVRGTALTSGITSSCGCKQHEPKREDLTGKRFGRLVVLEYDHIDQRRSPYWRCLCDCGNEVTVCSASLKSGNTRSCGCLIRDVTGDRCRTHGMSRSSLYRAWVHMRERCYNPNNQEFKNYGARGIFVCDEWMTFENFRDWALDNGYAEDLSIDRIDNNDGYYPENCRWATMMEQSNNKRTNRHITWGDETHTIAEWADTITQGNNRRNNHYVTWNNESRTIAQWARIFDINYNTLLHRIERGDMRDFEEYFKEVNDEELEDE